MLIRSCIAAIEDAGSGSNEGTGTDGDEVADLGELLADEGEVLVEEGVWGAGADAAGDEEDIKGWGGVKGVGGENGLGEGGVEGVHGRATGGGGDGVEG